MTSGGTTSREDKVRVAVLGGGCGSMAAVWGLAHAPDAERYAITVYQPGWRLGGKGACGRNRARGHRIEEHGLHLWAGCYENAFRMMREVYEELGRKPDAPLSTWYDPERPERGAFLPLNETTLSEQLGGRRIPWRIRSPTNGELPGEGHELPTLRSWLTQLLELSIDIAAGSLDIERRRAADEARVGRARRAPPGEAGALLGALKQAAKAARALSSSRPGRAVLVGLLDGAAVLLHRRMSGAERSVADPPDVHRRRRAEMSLDLLLATARGLLADDLLRGGFQAIDHLELTDWLRRHGAAERTVRSPLVMGWYSLAFARPHAPPAEPSLSAGVGLHAMLRVVFTYKGALWWKMRAGMGEVVFAPMYQVLRERGVRFRFFHEARSLGIDRVGASGDRVSSITMARQADLAEGLDDYEPLYDFRGLPCWPSEPLWEQLEPEQAAALRGQESKLERASAALPAVETMELRVGRDFDLVILGVPPPALRPLTAELAERQPPWGQMIDALATVPTAAMQLWLRKPSGELGALARETVGSGYVHPLDAFCDMSHLLPQEGRDPASDPARGLLYFCGALPDEEIPWSPAEAAPDAEQFRGAEELFRAWCESELPMYWPGLVRGSGGEGREPSTLDWSVFCGLRDSPANAKRLTRQYLRINNHSWERYVLSLPGTARFRRRSDESGFGNLYTAGDWLRTGWNCGCVESAVIGGLQASQAIAGSPARIIGCPTPRDR